METSLVGKVGLLAEATPRSGRGIDVQLGAAGVLTYNFLGFPSIL
jgi:hypothetical protein